jgi:hypothetical protein
MKKRKPRTSPTTRTKTRDQGESGKGKPKLRVTLYLSDFHCVENVVYYGVSEVDIRHAIATACYDGPMGDGNKYLVVFDTRANPLEVLYNESGNGMYVFHAMTCRNAYLHFLN